MHFIKLVFIISCGFVCLFPTGSLTAQVLPNAYKESVDIPGLLQRAQSNIGDDFYAIDSVRKISLTFADTSWWSQIDDSIAYASMRYGEIEFDSVVVTIKGSSSDFANPTFKKSFDITFDAVKPEQKIGGIERTNLHGGIFDPSHVREVLFYWIGGHYLPVVQSNFVHLEINGINWGVYTNTQQLNRDFLQQWFVDSEGPRWRGESPFSRIAPDTTCLVPGQDTGRQATPSGLHYLGVDSAAYWPFYTAKGGHEAGDWQKLVNFIEKLNTIPDSTLADSLPAYLDVDEALWYLAHEILLGDEDGYVFKTQSDYFLYHQPSTNEMLPLEYDGNSCLASGSIEWLPEHRAEDPCLPLINRLLNHEPWRQRYLAHFRTILEEHFQPDVLLSKVDLYSSLIDTFEQNDPIGDSVYLYSEFQSGVRRLKEIVEDRHAFLSALPQLNTPEVEFVSHERIAMPSNGPLVKSTDSILLSVQLAGIQASAVNLYYNTQLGQRFSRIDMFDDGTNGDRIAGDQVYTKILAPHAAQTHLTYYFEAIAQDSSNTRSYFPKGAEHDVFSFQVAPDREQHHPVRINELMASNSLTQADEAGEYDDWIELYNDGPIPINLNGFSLSDRLDRLDKWTITTDVIIPAYGYVIIWCDEDQDQGLLHTNFKLSRSGEAVFLTLPSMEISDQVEFEDLEADVSFARIIDGFGAFHKTSLSTFNSSNIDPSFSIDTTFYGLDTLRKREGRPTGVEDRILDISVFPNPIKSSEQLQVWHDGYALGNMFLIDPVGRVHSLQFDRLDHNRSAVTLPDLATGVYFLMLYDYKGSLRGRSRVMVKD